MSKRLWDKIAEKPTKRKYEEEAKLKVTAAECLHCHDIIFSRALYDFRSCTCGRTSIDGGLNYTKVGGAPEEFITFILVVPQSKVELYNDWNLRQDKYGKYTAKEYSIYGQTNIGYGRKMQYSDRKKKRRGLNDNNNIAKEKKGYKNMAYRKKGVKVSSEK